MRAKYLLFVLCFSTSLFSDYKFETVYLENGEEMSGSTVAAPFGNLILM
jgi:hypothetical protein